MVLVTKPNSVSPSYPSNPWATKPSFSNDTFSNEKDHLVKQTKDFKPETPAQHSNSSKSISILNTDRSDKHTLVIGSGPVGIRFVNEFLSRSPLANITLFGNELSEPYNRVQLSALLARKISPNAIHYELPSTDAHPNFKFINTSVELIDPEKKNVTVYGGEKYNYSELILATGAQAYQPNIAGIEKSGVFFFRSLNHAEALYARITRSRSLVVVGGGLLGIETARALRRFGTQITLAHQSDRLMNRQLDQKAADIVKEKLEQLGIEVVLKAGIKEIFGQERISSIGLYNGNNIACDTLVLCTGISPNTDLARKSGISIRNGILVSDRMLTSQPSIYAIGECCEHKGATYGLVNPGYEQAAVAADVIHGSNCIYKGSINVSKLKILEESVFSIGAVTNIGRHPLQKSFTFQDLNSGCYRKLIIRKNRIIGAVGVGAWDEFTRVQEALQQARRIWPWQKLSFRLRGSIQLIPQQSNVNLWPDDTIICQCNNLTKKTLCNAIGKNCNNATALQENTGAGSVCGSCQPLLSQLFNAPNLLQKIYAWRLLILGSLTCFLLLILLLSLPAAKVSTSVQAQGWYEAIWNSKFWKQATGFTLLGLTLLSLIMSLRKRLNIQWLGDFKYWRLTHALLGVSCCGVLFFHTGLHLGTQLNRLLILNFLFVIGFGALFGGFMALAHKMESHWAPRIKQWGYWLHLMVSWPLPVLLITHIISVYYF